MASLWLPVDRERGFVVLGFKVCKEYLLSAGVLLCIISILSNNFQIK